MKVDGSLKSLLQGVSQQPARDRLPGQCTEQINMSSDPVAGLTKRPPTDLVSSLGDVGKCSWYKFETRDGKKWLAKFTSSPADIEVTDLNGVPAPVSIGLSAKDYIFQFNSLRFTSIDETTYITNPDRIVGLEGTGFPYYNNRAGGVKAAIVQILGGAYGRNFVIRMNGGVAAQYLVPNGADKNDVQYARTSYIAQMLRNQLITNLPGPDWFINLAGDVILIQRQDGATFDLSTSDDAGNLNMKSMVSQVKTTADLPRFAPAGYVVRIATKADPDEDAFYRFVLEASPELVNGEGFGQTGYWKETVAPNTGYRFIRESMPVTLTYFPDTASFSFDLGTWEFRTSGSRVSNPDPSFVGGKITDMGSFQGRLVMVSGSNVIMSRTNKHNDFWIKSVTAQADTDPIDISSSTVEASAMLGVVPHNKDLVLFSAKGQFVVYGRNAITPSNASLVLTTSFEAELSAKPAPAGRNVFFATNYGRFTNIREFYTEGGTDINDTRPITQHIKEYIVGKVKNIAATSNYDTLIINTDTDREAIYVYQYIWADNEKVQSSWSKWILNQPVEYVFFDEELIYFVIETSSGYALLRMSLDVKDTEGITYPAYLDNRFDVFGVNTQFVLPYDYLSAENILCVQAAGCPNPGLLANIASKVFVPGQGWTITLAQNMEGGDILAGIPYMQSYTPTMPNVKDADGVVIGTAKLRVRNFIVSVQDTGYLEAQLNSKYYTSAPIVFEGRIISEPTDIIGKAALYNGPLIVPFREDTSLADFTIRSYSHLPLTLLDIEWVGQYTKKGKRISTGSNA